MIDFIANKAEEASDQEENNPVAVRRIQSDINQIDKAIENLWKALECGQAADMITSRIEQNRIEKDKLKAQLAVEKSRHTPVTAVSVSQFLNRLRRGESTSQKTKRTLMNLFINRIFVKGKSLQIIFNTGLKPVEYSTSLMENIESHYRKCGFSYTDCSSPHFTAPP